MAKRGATGLVSDVAKYVRSANRKKCGSPQRKEMLDHAITYIRKAAELEDSHGLTKGTAKKRISGLLNVDRLIVGGMKKCAKQTMAARKRAMKVKRVKQFGPIHCPKGVVKSGPRAGRCRKRL